MLVDEYRLSRCRKPKMCKLIEWVWWILFLSLCRTLGSYIIIIKHNLQSFMHTYTINRDVKWVERCSTLIKCYQCHRNRVLKRSYRWIFLGMFFTKKIWVNTELKYRSNKFAYTLKFARSWFIKTLILASWCSNCEVLVYM